MEILSLGPAPNFDPYKTNAGPGPGPNSPEYSESTGLGVAHSSGSADDLTFYHSGPAESSHRPRKVPMPRRSRTNVEIPKLLHHTAADSNKPKKTLKKVVRQLTKDSSGISRFSSAL